MARNGDRRIIPVRSFCTLAFVVFLCCSCFSTLCSADVRKNEYQLFKGDVTTMDDAYLNPISRGDGYVLIIVALLTLFMLIFGVLAIFCCRKPDVPVPHYRYCYQR
ncbi:unnamed protein product [Phytomonas sp. EM1]|nr:unnamed protein product [Phytomonas sp. EM1]|eukprot:CCW60175.1 unnamed protein product [Phytomonas sp. isolate EM1]